MSPDVPWMTRLLDELEETVRAAQLSKRELDEYRAEVRGSWDDTAAKDMAVRFFEPHAISSEAANEQLVNEITHLQACRSSLQQANEIIREMNEISRDVETNTTAIEDLFRILDSLQSQGVSGRDAGTHAIRRVRVILGQLRERG